jgi:hypothetical protein
VEKPSDEDRVPTQPRKQTTFFDLPRELRDNIYHLCSAHSSPVTMAGYKQLSHSLLFICRTIRKEAAPIFRADNVAKHEHYWSFKQTRVAELHSFCEAMRPYTIATPMSWSVTIHNHDRKFNMDVTPTVAWKALQSVLRQTAYEDVVLEAVTKRRATGIPIVLGDEMVARGVACGILWKWTREPLTRREGLSLEGSLAQLDWDFIASGRDDL